MSRTVSPSSQQPYGVARVTTIWNRARSSFYAVTRSVGTKVFRAMRPLKRDYLVRGHYAGYRKEQGVAKNSDVETLLRHAALY